MITLQDIFAAANRLAALYSSESPEVYSYADGFVRSVTWFKDAIWHDASEEPRHNEELLGLDTDGFSIYSWKNQEATWQEFLYNTGLQRYCYIADIIPIGHTTSCE